uniref:Uncharacterized protein n=1 Tax=Medicago truncatula TaxID=3880 RepID=Q2HUH3_MEDTR|nr:hypothetical protein MtrDRAFT_AC149134g17v2 [Medicago truncatula]
MKTVTALGLLTKTKIIEMHQLFSTPVPEAKITIVSKPYHQLKFSHHDLYYTPHNKRRFFYSHAT